MSQAVRLDSFEVLSRSAPVVLEPDGSLAIKARLGVAAYAEHIEMIKRLGNGNASLGFTRAVDLLGRLYPELLDAKPKAKRSRSVSK